MHISKNHNGAKKLYYGIFKMIFTHVNSSKVKLGNKERFDKQQTGIKEPFPVTNLPFTS